MVQQRDICCRSPELSGRTAASSILQIDRRKLGAAQNRLENGDFACRSGTFGLPERYADCLIRSHVATGPGRRLSGAPQFPTRRLIGTAEMLFGAMTQQADGEVARYKLC